MPLEPAMMKLLYREKRRDIMAVAVREIRPVAHLPLTLGMLRELDVAAIIDGLLPPHPDLGHEPCHPSHASAAPDLFHPAGEAGRPARLAHAQRP
jgi:hypothetical protein